MTNQDYKNAALAALKGKWAPAVLASIVIILVMVPYYIFNFGTTSITASIQTDPSSAPSWYWWTFLVVILYLLLFVVPLLCVGYYNAFKSLLKDGDDRVTANMFNVGLGKWGRNVWGMILMSLKLILWYLLLIIPGIIKAFGYALTPFLLVDCPELTPLQCIKLSDKMMKGHKFDLFFLELSFIGWILLGMLTLCIGYLWLMPYMYTSIAAFYQDVKAQYREQMSAEAPADGYQK